MTEITARLSTALADRYRIERHIGAGGMATVYLAEDLKHKRKVALKVLKPDLAAVLGAERFVQEITTTASLHRAEEAVAAYHDQLSWTPNRAVALLGLARAAQKNPRHLCR